jgi:DNA-binding CsgD family transcriptional regulator
VSPTAAAVRRVRALCRVGLPDRTFRAAVLEELRRLIDFGSHAWLLTDPETKVGSAPLAFVPDLGSLPQLIRLKYVTPVNRWTSLRPGHCATLAGATGGDLAHSPLWRELLSGWGGTDVASLVFADRFGCWGFLDLWRHGGSPDRFSPDEQALLASLGAGLTATLRGNQAAGFAAAPPSGPALPGAPDDPVVLLLSYELQLLAAEAGVDDGAARARAQLTGSEWISLRAARLGGGAVPGGGTIAVTIEPVTARGRLELYGRATGLTPRERELLHHLARGTDTRRLARDLELSPHTVQDHLKSVFAKTGTGSRASLLARALGTETGSGAAGIGGTGH